MFLVFVANISIINTKLRYVNNYFDIHVTLQTLD